MIQRGGDRKGVYLVISNGVKRSAVGYLDETIFVEGLVRSYIQLILDRNMYSGMKGWLMGFEPTATGATIQCSTPELQPP